MPFNKCIPRKIFKYLIIGYIEHVLFPLLLNAPINMALIKMPGPSNIFFHGALVAVPAWCLTEVPGSDRSVDIMGASCL